jgi:hypothetical protein
VLLIRIMTKMVVGDQGRGASGNNASTLQKSGLYVTSQTSWERGREDTKKKTGNC